MQNAYQVLGFANEVISPLARPLGPVHKRCSNGLLGRVLQRLCGAEAKRSRYAIKESKPKFGEVFLAIMVLGFSASAWNALEEHEQRKLLDFLRQLPASHPDAEAINRRYALLQVSGLVTMPRARV